MSILPVSLSREPSSRFVHQVLIDWDCGDVDALQPAAKAAGDFSESVDSITIVCGDAQLNRITNSVWRDRDRQYARVEFNPAPASDQRPCDIVEALAYPTADGTVIMLCDRPGIGVNKPPTFSWMNTKDVTNRDVDLLGQTISADLTHELIHIGNFAQCEFFMSF